MSDFLRSINLSEFFEMVMNNISWIVLVIAVVVIVGLFGGVFTGKYRWLWCSIMIASIGIVVMIGSNFFASFINSYVDNQLGEASRADIGHVDPQTAREIEELLTDSGDPELWEEEGGLFVHTKTYTKESGTITIRRYWFVTEAEVVTAKAEWKATSFMLKNSAQIKFTDPKLEEERQRQAALPAPASSEDSSEGESKQAESAA